MTIRLNPVGTRVGELVRVRGALHQVMTSEASGKRTYVRLSDGLEFPVDRADQLVLENQGDLTSELSYKALGGDIHQALTTDWGSFTESEKASAYRKQLYMAALDTLRVVHRRKAKFVEPLIAKVHAEQDESGLPIPSLRSLNRWSYRWIASGKDIRALADMNWRKGNRTEHDPHEWIDQIIISCIEKYMFTPPYATAAYTAGVADALVLIKSKEEGLPLRPRVNTAERSIGAHRIYDLLEKLGYYDRLVNEFGRKEARRRAKSLTTGPQGEFALHEVEVDHTKLDIEVFDADGLARRPWLTVLIDRYSRLILGFHITFDPPSSASVMMALRMAVRPKDKYLASVNYKFAFRWDCYGAPDVLYMDRGAEFRSVSLKATAQTLRIRLVDLPRASGQLKGKVERWFGVQNQGLIHALPGYVGSNVQKRLPENAIPKLDFQQLEIVVAAYIVDIYNNSTHGITKQWPSKRYAASISSRLNNKLPPPEELLGPATSPARTAYLTRAGIRFDNLIYRSSELIALWEARGGNCQVIVRTDESDASQVLVFDGSHKPWVTAQLDGKYAGLNLSVGEVHARMEADKQPAATADEMLQQAVARTQLQTTIDIIHPRNRVKTRAKAQPITAQHVSKNFYDADRSEGGLVAFDPTNPGPATTYGPQGPFSERSVIEKTMDASPEQFDAAISDWTNDTDIIATAELTDDAENDPVPWVDAMRSVALLQPHQSDTGDDKSAPPTPTASETAQPPPAVDDVLTHTVSDQHPSEISHVDTRAYSNPRITRL